MQITYDVKLPDRGRFQGGQKSEEIAAAEAFLQGTRKNMCFTYDEENEAKRGAQRLQCWRRRCPDGDLIDCYRKGSRLFIVRLSPKDVRERRAARNRKDEEVNAHDEQGRDGGAA